MKSYTTYYQSEIGLLEIQGSAEGSVSIAFVESDVVQNSASHPLIWEAERQSGSRQRKWQEPRPDYRSLPSGARE